jgi:hypothetical protein
VNLRPALLLLAVSACRSSAPAVVSEARADESTRASSRDGVAVVELFTSEGCSSCPPADVILGDEARSNPNVYALGFHVDYWDELGWPDRFASHEYTARQRAYSLSFGTSTLYTPEMIVGGADAFTGSDRARADESIARSLAHAAIVRLSVRARAAGPHDVTRERTQDVTVEFEAPGAPSDAVVGIAVVQREATTIVRGGENSGRTLRHTNVVRAFTTVGPTASPVTLPRPESLPSSEGEIVAFVQRTSGPAGTKPIIGAARASLP